MFRFKLTEKRKEYLSRLELDDSFAVLNHLPRTYTFYDLTPELTKYEDQQKVVIKGEVTRKTRLVTTPRRVQVFNFYMIYNEEEYKVITYNRPYLAKSISIGSEVMISGKYNHYKKEIVLIDVVNKEVKNTSIKPIYHLCEGVTGYEFQKVVSLAYNDLIEHDELKEIIPVYLKEKYQLVDRNVAFYDAHFPSKKEKLRQAFRYLKYEELLIYSLKLQMLKNENKTSITSAIKKVDEYFVASLLKNNNFTLTNDQRVVIREIIEDLKKDGLMYRMLQGDVGTGKTLVAALALAANFSAGYQGVIMAPTDILARQHYAFLKSFYEGSNIKVSLLVSSLSSKQKKEIVDDIKNGLVDVVVGTHALIQKGVDYQKLGLAIIDEQHRFGVNQRRMLKEKGDNVETLMMTATPIPRTLAITLYGDMDISILKEFPNKKRDVSTKVVYENDLDEIKKEILEKTKNNEKVFVVCPLIVNGDEERNSVEVVYEDFVDYFKGKVKVGILHGKMSSEEKEEIMLDFKNNDTDILVATTVVEVGIDVKNATTMIIFDAQSFGLATLHQLRGRIGRGGQKGVCYLVCTTAEKLARQRLKYLEDNEDGFEIARYDLASRGPGDISGVRQSGIPDLNVSDIYSDLKILEVARVDAQNILKNKEDINNQEIISYISSNIRDNLIK